MQPTAGAPEQDERGAVLPTSLSILIVDDDVFVREATRTVIEIAMHSDSRIEEAKDGD